MVHVGNVPVRYTQFYAHAGTWRITPHSKRLAQRFQNPFTARLTSLRGPTNHGCWRLYWIGWSSKSHLEFSLGAREGWWIATMFLRQTQLMQKLMQLTPASWATKQNEWIDQPLSRWRWQLVVWQVGSCWWQLFDEFIGVSPQQLFFDLDS